MRLRASMIALAALLGLAAARPASAAPLIYGIGEGGASLIRFSADDPGSVESVGPFGGADTFLDAIDFRPATGQLYGYRSATNSYFIVDVNTGMLTSATAPNVGASTNTFLLGIDWNPTIDRLRVVTDSTQNIVYNPNTGTAAAFTPLSYASDDPNADFIPLVIDNAYSNNLPDATSTQQYVLDYDLNVLATLANNAGTLQTVGEITLDGEVLDFNDFAGFDIFTDFAGNNTAYALLTVGGMVGIPGSGTTGLYTIDLTSGAATSLGAIGSGFGPVYSLAVVPIPEPSSLALAGVGSAALGLLVARRRRRSGGLPETR